MVLIFLYIQVQVEMIKLLLISFYKKVWVSY
jgi:hypothetical protein